MPDAVLHIVLYQPEIAANAGAIGRTCVALGAKLWLVRPLGFHLNDRQLRRAGLDYWKHLDWEAVDDWGQLLDSLPRAERSAWFFSKTADLVYTQVRFQPGEVLVSLAARRRGCRDRFWRTRTDACGFRCGPRPGA